MTLEFGAPRILWLLTLLPWSGWRPMPAAAGFTQVVDDRSSAAHARAGRSTGAADGVAASDADDRDLSGGRLAERVSAGVGGRGAGHRHDERLAPAGRVADPGVRRWRVARPGYDRASPPRRWTRHRYARATHRSGTNQPRAGAGIRPGGDPALEQRPGRALLGWTPDRRRRLACGGAAGRVGYSGVHPSDAGPRCRRCLDRGCPRMADGGSPQRRRARRGGRFTGGAGGRDQRA